MSYRPIGNYGIIGDLTTAALVSNDGSVDFMCFPHFDSPAIFAALLDRKNGGHFQIAPVSAGFSLHQTYHPDTNILLTGFRGEQGIAVVSDFMPVERADGRRCLVRRVKVVRGEIPLRAVCAPRFDYARAEQRVEKKRHGVLFVPGGKNLPALLLRASVPLQVANGEAFSEFKLRTGQSAWFVLEEAASESSAPDQEWISGAFKETMNYWTAWIGRSKYRGRWREMVNRSALTLKLLTSQRHGAIVAAPTFGLPESVGGARNWDYRYTWIRDTSFALSALLRLGYMEEARSLMGWMEQRCRELKPGKPLQVMYRIDGSRDLPEKILENLEGYKQSRPVRIGNGASGQLQLDVYGEFMNAIDLYDQVDEPISYDFWRYITAAVGWVCRNWRRPDEGIWEVRGGAKPFLYSRAMCWLALERAIQIARRRSYPAPLARWHRVRDEIYTDIYKTFWNSRLKCFTQYRGAKAMDASLLLLPLVNFISPTDPRWKSTLRAIEKELVEDAFVYRYRPDQAAPDGLSGAEGTFSVCSFWYVECLARANDLKQARFNFEKVLGYANPPGLYAEQLGPRGELLGNFPQALSHLALINAAWTLNERISATE
jgi:GH15 family glucan-1,4-alpha-glucosidase